MGDDDTLLVSTNGTDWVQRVTPESFSALAFGNNMWVALTGGSTVYASSNLVSWTKANIGFLGDPVLTSICCGLLADSADFKQRLHPLFPSQFEFYGTGSFEYRLERSFDLVSWTPVSSWAPGSDDYLVWDAGASQGPAAFWRAVGRPW